MSSTWRFCCSCDQKEGSRDGIGLLNRIIAHSDTILSSSSSMLTNCQPRVCDKKNKMALRLATYQFL